MRFNRYFIRSPVIIRIDYLKLLGTVFIQKADRNSHYIFVIRGDSISKRNLDSIVIIVLLISTLSYFFMFAEFNILFHSHKRKRLVAAAMLDICIPAGIAQSRIVSDIA